MMKYTDTREMIFLIAHALGELNDKAVFVGGATLPFYIPEKYLAQVKPTEDINVVMEIVGRNQNIMNEKLLREKGFRHDTSKGATACRWIFRDFKVDVMSSDQSGMGFTNRWFREGIQNSIQVLNSPVPVRIFNLPYFIAAKIEAFKGRGKGDFVGSPDIEDIISVLEVASGEHFESQLKGCSQELNQYLRKEFSDWVNSRDFLDALPGAVFNRQEELIVIDRILERVSL